MLIGITPVLDFFNIISGIGCPNLEPIGNIWVKRKGDHLFLRCNETNQNWFLTCRDDHWIGEVGNCSSGKNGKYTLMTRPMP